MWIYMNVKYKDKQIQNNINSVNSEKQNKSTQYNTMWLIERETKTEMKRQKRENSNFRTSAGLKFFSFQDFVGPVETMYQFILLVEHTHA